MICNLCKQEADKLTNKRIPTLFGFNRWDSVCDDCLCELDDYYDRKREDRRVIDE